MGNMIDARTLPTFLRNTVRWLPLLLCCWLLACNNTGELGQTPLPSTPSQASSVVTAAVDCPATLRAMLPDSNGCLTPQALRLAYSLNPLLAKGFDGKGQTIVDIVSYGSPMLQHDLDVFDQQFQLPALTVQQIAPLGTVPYDPQNSDMAGWATETDLDVEIMHALAPGAHIVVLTSPVDETEGMAGLPQFLQLEQYAVSHQLGQILCQSFVTAEVNFPTIQNQQFLQQFASFDEQATTKDGWTIFAASGDNGATDSNNAQSTTFSPMRTVDFAADMPWVIAVGGTTLQRNTSSSGFSEIAWQGSGGGFSKLFPEPDYQKLLPQTLQAQFHGERGLPDVAADADPETGMAVYLNGQWTMGGGTSASQPAWTAMIAIADQMAGHPLGFLNPALYQVGTSPRAASDFRDIVTGNNSHQGTISVQGYDAVAGWDPVTGFGAPLASFLLPDLIAASQKG